MQALIQRIAGIQERFFDVEPQFLGWRPGIDPPHVRYVFRFAQVQKLQTEAAQAAVLRFSIENGSRRGSDFACHTFQPLVVDRQRLAGATHGAAVKLTKLQEDLHRTDSQWQIFFGVGERPYQKFDAGSRKGFIWFAGGGPNEVDREEYARCD